MLPQRSQPAKVTFELMGWMATTILPDSNADTAAMLGSVCSSVLSCANTSLFGSKMLLYQVYWPVGVGGKLDISASSVVTLNYFITVKGCIYGRAPHRFEIGEGYKYRVHV